MVGMSAVSVVVCYSAVGQDTSSAMHAIMQTAGAFLAEGPETIAVPTSATLAADEGGKPAEETHGHTDRADRYLPC